MKKITLYVGLNDKDTKTQKITTVDAFKMLSNLCLVYTDGATIYDARGIYKHDDGTVIAENTLRIEIFNPIEQNIMPLITTIKKALNQESIGIETTETISDFI